MNLKRRSELTLLLLILLISPMMNSWCDACGPGKGNSRRRNHRKLTPLVYKQHVPNVSENTLGASGLPEGRITRTDSRFKDLVPNYNPDIIFKDEEGTGADRLMTQRCKERLNTLAISVMNLWPGVKLRVTEGWDEEGFHAADSLHYEGRALDITTSDRDKSKYGMLARLAVEAGFDWVYYESRAHIHVSVKSESSQAAKTLGCFTGESTLILSNGNRISMSELQIGDEVLALNEAGNLEPSEVLLFMHRNPDTRTHYIRLSTASGSSVTITPSHLILRWQKPQISSLYHEAMPVYAKDVQIGDQLLIRGHDPANPLFVDKITNIKHIVQTGVYAPLTITGSMVVNDIVVSCYAVLNSQRLAHLAFAPLRFYNNLETSLKRILHVLLKPSLILKPQTTLPSINSRTNSNYNIINNTSNNNYTRIRHQKQPIGVHWYCRFLEKISHFIFPPSWLYFQ